MTYQVIIINILISLLAGGLAGWFVTSYFRKQDIEREAKSYMLPLAQILETISGNLRQGEYNIPIEELDIILQSLTDLNPLGKYSSVRLESISIRNDIMQLKNNADTKLLNKLINRIEETTTKAQNYWSTI